MLPSIKYDRYCRQCKYMVSVNVTRNIFRGRSCPNCSCPNCRGILFDAKLTEMQPVTYREGLKKLGIFQ
jgi:hypothetical protein